MKSVLYWGAMECLKCWQWLHFGLHVQMMAQYLARCDFAMLRLLSFGQGKIKNKARNITREKQGPLRTQLEETSFAGIRPSLSLILERLSSNCLDDADDGLKPNCWKSTFSLPASSSTSRLCNCLLGLFTLSIAAASKFCGVSSTWSTVAPTIRSSFKFLSHSVSLEAESRMESRQWVEPGLNSSPPEGGGD